MANYVSITFTITSTTALRYMLVRAVVKISDQTTEQEKLQHARNKTRNEPLANCV